jgi:hypothetical protein
MYNGVLRAITTSLWFSLGNVAFGLAIDCKALSQRELGVHLNTATRSLYLKVPHLRFYCDRLLFRVLHKVPQILITLESVELRALVQHYTTIWSRRRTGSQTTTTTTTTTSMSNNRV